ncbi:MAG: shikimate dehydrogenase, partial [Candidatus Bathyarchaeia archaeon]
TFSPAMHNAAFRHLGLNAIYVAFAVKPSDLVDALRGVRALNVRGLNVTIPHKEAIITLLDDVDTLAKNVGAVNTVTHEDGVLRGFNTDGAGALETLRENGVDPRNKRIVILGAGGAAKAIALTLAPMAREVTIANRTVEKAEALSQRLRTLYKRDVHYCGLNSKNVKTVLREAEILINTTSVGMYPNAGETPIPHNFLHENVTVFDIVYNPRETRLLREARKVGAKTVGGLGMLVHQGVEAFELWTHMKPPVEVMKRVIESMV